MKTSLTITSEVAGNKPHILTRQDVAAFRKAQHISYHLDEIHSDAETPWTGTSRLSQLTLSRPKKAPKDGWETGSHRNEDEESYYINVSARYGGWESRRGEYDRTRYEIRSPLSIDRAHFYEMYLDQQDDWSMFAAFIKPGDELSVSLRADNNTGYICNFGVDLHHDEAYLHIVRTSPKTGKSKTYAFLISSSVCEDNSARMIKGKYLLNWRDPRTTIDTTAA